MSRQFGGEFAVCVSVVDGRAGGRLGSGGHWRERGRIAVCGDDFDVNGAVRKGRRRFSHRAGFIERKLLVGGGLVSETPSENRGVAHYGATMAGRISASRHLVPKTD